MLLVWEFVNVPLSFIDRQLKQSGNLFLAYEAIELAERNYDMKANRLYQRLAKSRKSNPNSTIPDPTQPDGNWTSGLKQELLAARHKREKDDGKFDLSITDIISYSTSSAFSKSSHADMT
jgi:hypothetical protein